MRRALCVQHAWPAWLLALGLAFFCGGARAQELPRVTVARTLLVDGLSMDPKVPDLIGLSRVRFQGLIAAELTSVGYRIGDVERTGSAAPLVLTGLVKEETCDDFAPSQCRVAIQWELQERSGLVVYRTLTRAVEQQPTLERLRRALVQGALRSLLGRRRFTLRLLDPSGATDRSSSGPLGFRACQRSALELPSASRAALAGLVLVESGSNLAVGAILSADGLILTSSRELVAGAPLRVRFSAQQVLPARVVASAAEAGVALLRTGAHTDSTCLAQRGQPLSAGVTVFGVGSVVRLDSALSLSSAVVGNPDTSQARTWWPIERRIAAASGAPLLDSEGRLTAIVVAPAEKGDTPRALDVGSALAALDVKPAPISDPRLVGEVEGATELGYVRDPDDPPFELTRRYTFGTGPTAASLRTAASITAGLGALGVAATWLQFRGKDRISADEHHRLVVYNDVSWAVLALGAVGVGVSFALPQPHDVVAGHGSARRRWSLRLAGNGLGASGEF